MTSINETFINALLADASYVQLSSNGILFNEAGLLTALGNRLTPSLAQFFVNNFEVLNQELS